MHNRIFKYSLESVDIQWITMPIGAKILSVQTQEGLNRKETICLWAMVDMDAKTALRGIAIIGTGNPFPKIGEGMSMIHLDTVQQYGLVWHIFELVNKDHNIDDLQGVRFGQGK